MLPSLWRKRDSDILPPLDNFLDKFFYGWPSYESNYDLKWSPNVDINETDNDFVLDVELPGIDKKDIKVEVKDNVLSISGERRQEKNTENANSSRIERHYGKYVRTFRLPDTVLADNLAAKYKDGVLTITLPKTEKAKPKEIAVEVK